HRPPRGAELGHGPPACDLAAVLEERDVLHGAATGPPDADVRLRVEILRGAGRGDTLAATHGAIVDHDAVRRVRVEARALRQSLGGKSLGTAPNDVDLGATGLLLALAYPDRVAPRPPGAGCR